MKMRSPLQENGSRIQLATVCPGSLFDILRAMSSVGRLRRACPALAGWGGKLHDPILSLTGLPCNELSWLAQNNGLY